MQKAVEEFKAQTRMLGMRADSPASARIKSKSSPSWHGRIFENFRNDFLDAVPHEIRQRGSDKSMLRRNQFGFNLAGPVVIPKLFNGGRTTFFSLSYEGMREKISRSSLRTVPNEPERQGDFSSTVDLNGQLLPIYDPASTRPNPNFDPSRAVAEDNLQYLRDPFPGNRIPVTRLDSVASETLRHYPTPNASVGPFFRNNYFAISPETNTANGMIVRVDHTFRERQRFEFSTAFSNGFAGAARLFNTVADSNPADRQFSSRRGGLRHTFTLSPRTVHVFDFEAATTASQNMGDAYPAYRLGSYAPIGRSNPQVRGTRNSFELSDSLSTRRGQHSLKLSGAWQHSQSHALAAQYPKGMFRFTPGLTSLPGINNTGHAFASFLLGLPDQAEIHSVTSPSYFRRNQFGAAARDSWEVRRGLTLSGGLNLDISTPRVEKYDRQSTVDLNLLNPANGQPGALVVAGSGETPQGFQPVQVRLEPSAAVAWNPLGSSKTVIRVSYSRSYQAIPLPGGQWGTQAFNPYPTYVSPNAQLEPAVILSSGLPEVLPDSTPEALNNTVADLIDRSTRQPRLQSGTVQFQHQIPGDVMLTAGAYRSDGKNLLIGNASANPNAIPLEALEHRDSLNDEAFRRTLRPYPQYVGFDLNGMYPAGRYKRDAGYLRLEKRTSSGLGLSAYYEWGKQMDDYSGPYGIQDVYNRDNEWSMTSGANPHHLSLSYVYELPLGPSKSIFSYTDWRRYLVEGWSVSGMTSVYGGDPLAIYPQFNNTGGVVQSLRVNTVPGVDASVPNPGPDLWFNPLAFAQPDDFTIGNASRTHSTLRAPGSQNHDLSLSKRFALQADRAVEFSAVAFNFINHANWTDPDTMIGPASAPNANAGKIIGSRGSRVIQLGLRYSF